MSQLGAGPGGITGLSALERIREMMRAYNFVLQQHLDGPCGGEGKCIMRQ